MTHVRVWRFRPPADREAAFLDAYGPTGRWARLFAATPDFVGTHLLRPEEPGGYWLTIDRWASREAFDRFQKSHGKTYRRIDAEMREIAGEEEFIGTFEEP
jgi:hypothetical protein